jgi:hypothetical protein
MTGGLSTLYKYLHNDTRLALLIHLVPDFTGFVVRCSILLSSEYVSADRLTKGSNGLSCNLSNA